MNSSTIAGIGMTSQRTRSRLVSRLVEEGITNQEVLGLIETTPRHLFVDDAISHRAYEDTALPIGKGQTISQPYIVARMTEALIESGNCDKVLEIGTGSGYQSAVLSRVCGQLYTVERIRSLQMEARKRLTNLGLHNVSYLYGDGMKGWLAAAPFDAIIVTAAPTEVPEALLRQLKPGGRLIIPVGSTADSQELLVITHEEDDFSVKSLGKVKFVPLLAGTIA